MSVMSTTAFDAPKNQSEKEVHLLTKRRNPETFHCLLSISSLQILSENILQNNRTQWVLLLATIVSKTTAVTKEMLHSRQKKTRRGLISDRLADLVTGPELNQ